MAEASWCGAGLSKERESERGSGREGERGVGAEADGEGGLRRGLGRTVFGWLHDSSGFSFCACTCCTTRPGECASSENLYGARQGAHPGLAPGRHRFAKLLIFRLTTLL